MMSRIVFYTHIHINSNKNKNVTKLVFSLFIIIAMLVFAAVLLQKYVNREAFCNFICFCFFLKHKSFMLYLLEATGLLLLLQGIQDKAAVSSFLIQNIL